jgi:hypothetical protein
MLQLAILKRRLPATLLTVTATALLALGILAARSWLAAHDAAVRLAATLEIQEQILTQANERQRQRNAALSTTLAGIAQAKRRVNTPAMAAVEIPQLLPPLPQPLVLQIPPSTPAQPEPPAEAIIPQSDLKPIYDYLQDCRACEASLTVARDDLTDERAKVGALTVERDAAIRAARDGGFWSRLRRNTKWFVIGAAAGALAATASR